MMTIKIYVIYRHDRRYITITRRAETLAFVRATVVVVAVAAAVVKDRGPEHVRFNVTGAEKCLRKRRKKKNRKQKMYIK